MTNASVVNLPKASKRGSTSTAWKLYLHLFVFGLIYIEFGYHMVVAGAIPGALRMMILLGITAPLLLRIRSFAVESLGLFAYLFCLILLSSLRDDSFGNSLLWMIPIAIAFIVVNTVDFMDLVKTFNRIVFFLAAFSLVTFLISLIFPQVIAMLPSLGHVYDSPATIRNAFFSVCISNSEAVRNYGITWEPGAFCILLCMSLYCVLAFERKKNLYKMLVLVAAIITTFSTMGYFVMAGILAITMLQKKRISKRARISILLIVAALVVVLLLMPSSVTDLVFSKLSGLFNEGEDMAYTTQARLNAIRYPFEAFLKSPLVGVGYDRFVVINVTLCDSVATNTILNWFAIMGVTLGVPCTYFYLRFIKMNADHLKLSAWSMLVLIIAAVLLVSTESLLRISLMYIIVFYGTGKLKFENENK